jgi:mRNA-degrading endonuclease toxin of MazEF toxin-antitoxin module
LSRGEIRWYTFRPPDKRRPVLILTRNEVMDRLNEIIVAPVTRTIRGLASRNLLPGALEGSIPPHGKRSLCVPTIQELHKFKPSPPTAEISL